MLSLFFIVLLCYCTQAYTQTLFAFESVPSDTTLVELDATSGAVSNSIGATGEAGVRSALFVDGVLHAAVVRGTDTCLVSIDHTSGAVIDEIGCVSVIAVGVTVNSAGEFYATSSLGTDTGLFRVDFVGGNTFYIAQINGDERAIEFGPNDVMYAYGEEEFGTFDLDNGGQFTLLNDAAPASAAAIGLDMSFNPNTGVMHAVGCTLSGCELHAIDLGTFVFTSVDLDSTYVAIACKFCLFSLLFRK